MLAGDNDLVEKMAIAIYADSYTQYGTCTPHHWSKTSEVQREFCRGQARAALEVLEGQLMIKGWKKP